MSGTPGCASILDLLDLRHREACVTRSRDHAEAAVTCPGGSPPEMSGVASRHLLVLDNGTSRCRDLHGLRRSKAGVSLGSVLRRIGSRDDRHVRVVRRGVWWHTTTRWARRRLPAHLGRHRVCVAERSLAPGMAGWAENRVALPDQPYLGRAWTEPNQPSFMPRTAHSARGEPTSHRSRCRISQAGTERVLDHEIWGLAFGRSSG
jgi:hypothetical protein